MNDKSVPLPLLANHIGQTVGISDWRLITQEQIDGFAEICGDRQWIHIDRERAAREIGGTVAHGFLTLSMISDMALNTGFDISGVSRRVNYGFDKLRFVSMVRPGDKIRLTMELKDVAPKSGGYAVTRRCVVEVAGREKPALIADWISIFFA